MVDERLKLGRCTALFSATLSPPSYYKAVLGCDSDEQTHSYALPSPFVQEKLCLLVCNQINTRWAMREQSLEPIARLLFEMVSAKAGNYIAYFPSYQYLQKEAEVFSQLYPQLPLVLQSPQEDEFLAQFDQPHPERSLLGFAVLVAAYGVGCAVGGLLQDASGPRPAGLWGTVLLAGGFFAAALVPPANAALFLVVYSLPAGLGSAFLAPAVLACAQKWYQDKKGWATGVAGVAMGLSGAFFTLFVKGVGGRWGIRVCFAALGAVMLVVCGAGALILENPPATAKEKTQPGLDYRQMLRTPQYKLCAAAVALSAPAVLLFSPEIFKIAAERGLPESAAPYSIVLGSAASAAGRMLLPAVSDRLGRKPVLYAVYLGLAAGSAWFAFAGQWWVLAAYAVLTFFYSGGAAVQPSFNTDLFGLPHAGVNYGFIALGMSGGSILSYIGAQALPLAARHWLAGICAAAGLICVSLVKPVENG